MILEGHAKFQSDGSNRACEVLALTDRQTDTMANYSQIYALLLFCMCFGNFQKHTYSLPDI